MVEVKTSQVGAAPNKLTKGDVVEVSEGTIVAAMAAVVVYIIHQNVSLPTEIESAVMVLVYAGVRLAVRYLRDTRPSDQRE